MEFKIQDILKNLIPGILIILLLFAISHRVGYVFYDASEIDKFKDFSEILFVIFLVISYFLGFLLDTVASILENDVLYRFLNRPSFYLLTGKSHVKYSLANREQIVQRLLIRGGYNMDGLVLNSTITTNLFKIANTEKDREGSKANAEKITEYYNSYIFARNVTCVIILTFLITISLMVFSWHELKVLFFIQLFLLPILLIRLRQRAFYYSATILNSIDLK